MPMVVQRTNDHFDRGIGMKVSCRSTEADHRPREEREKGPRILDFMSRYIHSVSHRTIKVGDWVAWENQGTHHQGRVIFLTNEEATVRRRRIVDGLPPSVTLWLEDLSRILPPSDLTTPEKASPK
jgi:hypothetical protein